MSQLRDENIIRFREIDDLNDILNILYYWENDPQVIKRILNYCCGKYPLHERTLDGK